MISLRGTKWVRHWGRLPEALSEEFPRNTTQCGSSGGQNAVYHDEDLVKHVPWQRVPIQSH